MVYVMVFSVDGGCRGNGTQRPVAAATAIQEFKRGRTISWQRILSPEPRPTNQRAEIMAIALALEKAIDKYNELDYTVEVDLTIKSDSRYAVNCMNEWIYRWTENGWINAAGRQVANTDLLKEASRLEDELKTVGTVTYEWVPREQNVEADRLCNELLDEMQPAVAHRPADTHGPVATHRPVVIYASDSSDDD